MKITLALVTILAMGRPALLGQAETPIVPITKGEKIVFSALNRTFLMWDCSVYLKPGKSAHYDRLAPEGMVKNLEGTWVISGALYAYGNRSVVIDGYFDRSRKQARRQEIMEEDIDYLLFKKK